MRTARLAGLGGVLVCALLTASCGGSDKPAPGSAEDPYVLPTMPAPAKFQPDITHPYLPLRPGARWVYTEKSTDGLARNVVTVLARPRIVDGVTATVVHDVVTLDGKLSEDTFDWYAQDQLGNVWYLGEDTTAYEPGKAPTKEGSWEAGIHGARAGIAMPARPEVGDRYRQEFSHGVAEDKGEVVSLHAKGSVPWGAFADAIETRDTDGLEPGVTEHKFYVRDVGTVLEEEKEGRLELVSFTPGRS